MSRARVALAVLLVAFGVVMALLGLWFLGWQYAAIGAGLALVVTGLLVVDVGRAR